MSRQKLLRRMIQTLHRLKRQKANLVGSLLRKLRINRKNKTLQIRLTLARKRAAQLRKNPLEKPQKKTRRSSQREEVGVQARPPQGPINDDKLPSQNNNHKYNRRSSRLRLKRMPNKRLSKKREIKNENRSSNFGKSSRILTSLCKRRRLARPFRQSSSL